MLVCLADIESVPIESISPVDIDASLDELEELAIRIKKYSITNVSVTEHQWLPLQQVTIPSSILHFY